MRLPRTLRLDPSDQVVFSRAAEPGEWAVPGGFAFWDEDPAAMAGKRRQEFRAGFLGLASFSWSTLVEVAEATAAEREAAVAALAAHIRAAYGAPDEAAARAAAEEEITFAASLCDHPPGTVLALTRSLEEGPRGQEVRERFRTLHRRAAPHRDFGALPVFAVVEVEGEEPVDRPDLTALGRDGA
jgi:ADP-ribose pyrophosphatase YjhB (NUDIX family)